MEITCKYRMSSDVFIKRVRTYLKKLFRRMKVHAFWYGWWDVQPERNDGALHAHVFIEIDWAVFRPDVVVDGALFDLMWKYGEVRDVRGFDCEQGGVNYAAKKHEHPFDGIECPNNQHRCRIRDCWFERDINNFINRDSLRQ
jgi:hypothetical protein